MAQIGAASGEVAFDPVRQAAERLQTLDTLARTVAPLAADEDETPDVAALAAQRKHHVEAAKARQTVLQRRQQVETSQLSMQNLKYERDRLLQEIDRCRSFKSIYQDTTMHTEEEFSQLAGEEDKTAASESDPHELMLARLRFELKERQRLEKERQHLQAERNEAAKINKQKKAELMRLEQDLKSVIAAATPIGTSLDKFLA